MQFLTGILITLPLASASQMTSLLSSREQGTSTCTDTHIFLARGWNEDYPGRQTVLMGAFSTALYSSPTSSDYEDIIYESSFEANYCDSISEGVANGQAQMIAYNKRCPKSKLVVSGYSQGAYVVGDMFAGGGGTFGDCVQKSNEPFDIDSDAGKMGKHPSFWKEILFADCGIQSPRYCCGVQSAILLPSPTTHSPAPTRTARTLGQMYSLKR